MMRRKPGFVGPLADFRRDRTTGLFRATVVLPSQDLDAFHRAIGVPASGIDPGSDPDACPAVALLPAIHPRHPDGHDEALYDAALDVLEALLAAGKVRIDARRSARTVRLDRAVLKLPLYFEDGRICRA